MAAIPALSPQRSAIVPLDLQTGIVGHYVKDASLMPRAAAVVAAARSVGAPIVYVKVGFRPGVPEASPRHALLSAVKASDAHQRFFQGTSGAIAAPIAPLAADPVVTKSRISAFAGTDLDLLLRARDVDTVVLFGIATSGVVLASALDALDLDYRVIVVGDCCADREDAVHACVIERVLPQYATVASAEAVIGAIDGRDAAGG
jgi:nicotinamidase-related amidase